MQRKTYKLVVQTAVITTTAAFLVLITTSLRECDDP